MQIHQLPEYSGAPSSDAVMPVDDNTSTYKLPFSTIFSTLITSMTGTLNGAVQTVKSAIDTIGASLKTLTDRFSVSGSTVTLNGTLVSNNSYRCNTSTTSNEAAFRATSQNRDIIFSAGTPSNSGAGIFDNGNGNYILLSNPSGNVSIPHSLYARNPGVASGTQPVLLSSDTSGARVSYLSSWSNKGLGVSAQFGSTNGYSTETISVVGSDRRLKKNIRPCEKSGLEAVKKFSVRQFDWKSDGKHWDFGLVAQDVREIDDNGVCGEETDDMYLGINVLYFTNMLIKAVQELSAEVEELKNEQ